LQRWVSFTLQLTDSGLIIHHEVTDEGDDRRQLYPVAQQTKTELGQETLDVLADGGDLPPFLRTLG